MEPSHSITLGAHVDVDSGFPFKSADFSSDPDGIPLVKGENIGLGRIEWERSRYWPQHQAEGLDRYYLTEGDIVLAMDRPWIPSGLKFGVVEHGAKPALLVQRVARLRARPTLDQRYLRYVISSPGFIAHVQNEGRGVGVPHISAEQIRRYQLKLPDLPSQRRIADVLSAYDELIETNRRRMGLLEEAARLLYREWFVRLRHPSFAKATADKPGHPRTGLPAGWRTVAASEAIEVNPTVKIPKDAPTPWVEMADLATDSMVLAPSENRVGGSGTRFQNGDTLMARITPCLENGKTGYVAFLPEGGAARGSTEFIVLRGRTVTPEFVYCFARDENTRQHAMRSMVGASGRQRVHASCFDKLTIVEPSAAALSEFTKIARPLFEQVHTLHRQNRQLRAARDLLLPKLMSGRIAV